MQWTKEKILSDATTALNSENQPWVVRVEGDAIIGSWKWMDARFFATNTISEEDREYEFIVILKDSGKWKEKDKKNERSSKVTFNDGKIGIGMEKSVFKGKMKQKSISFSIGQNQKREILVL